MAFRHTLGMYVESADQAHANGDVDYFNVNTGVVLITIIYGIVTTAPGGAVSLNVGNNPTLGTATTVTWWTAADINGMGIGDIIGQRLVAGVATTTLNTFGGAVVRGAQYIALPGTIFVRGTAVQGNSTWYLYYIPLAHGANVTAI